MILSLPECVESARQPVCKEARAASDTIDTGPAPGRETLETLYIVPWFLVDPSLKTSTMIYAKRNSPNQALTASRKP